MHFVTFVYKNWQGQVRTIKARQVGDPATVAAALEDLLDTNVSWRTA